MIMKKIINSILKRIAFLISLVLLPAGQYLLPKLLHYFHITWDFIYRVFFSLHLLFIFKPYPPSCSFNKKQRDNFNDQKTKIFDLFFSNHQRQLGVNKAKLEQQKKWDYLNKFNLFIAATHNKIYIFMLISLTVFFFLLILF